ncbi:hypothetical protein SAMN05421813_11656 [Daejeonella rubra]|uniref:Uncharacterized protein n=1 Tax=Daejeonella rubra TaxID=990371 RepID=A0A1G9UGX2_9SPHI|nr:hypothetical protein [Daejeonella rubra]SDM58775.1 hypothetical protein SAMN05421813_11656 [Daejeonella rubra]
MSVMITAAADSAAFRLARILNTEDVYFAAYADMPAISGKRFLKISAANSPSFTHEVLKICLDHNIKEIYPLMRDEIVELSASRQLFEEYDIKLVIPSIPWIETRLNDLLFQSSNLFILINGKVRAGDIPANGTLPDNEENGVFQWELKNGQLIFGSFIV